MLIINNNQAWISVMQTIVFMEQRKIHDHVSLPDLWTLHCNISGPCLCQAIVIEINYNIQFINAQLGWSVRWNFDMCGMSGFGRQEWNDEMYASSNVLSRA